MNEAITNGKMDVMGINVDISKVLGQTIVDQYIAQLSEEDMNVLMNFITSDLFGKSWGGATIVKVREKDNWGNYRDKELTIGELIKAEFNNQIKDELRKKVQEIIASTDYQKKIEEIANELVDYSINGYRDDMKARIRERLIGNVVYSEPYYDGMSLQAIINQCIDARMKF